MIRRIAVAIGLPILLYLSAAAVGGVVRGPVVPFPDAADEVEIGLLFGPIHVDFLLPATPETRRALGFAREAGVPVDHNGVAHFIVGWGAEQFYTTAGTFADVSLNATLRAVTGDASVLRIDVTGDLPPGFEMPRVRLSPAQYEALLAAISDTVAGSALHGAGFTDSDGFLAAAGRFHIFRTCNTWVSDMLRAAGVEMGLWTPTPYALRLSLWRLGQ